MESEYRHTQFGTLVFVVFIVTGVLIVVVALAIITGSRWGSAVLMICFYLLGLALFYSFTIKISKEKLNFWFGVGVVRMETELRTTERVILCCFSASRPATAVSAKQIECPSAVRRFVSESRVFRSITSRSFYVLQKGSVKNIV